MTMASTLTHTLSLTPSTSHSYLSQTRHSFRFPTIKLPSFSNNNRNNHRVFFKVSASSSSSFQALIFDCDGVILESEHLHRQAYNDAFLHFNVRSPSSSSSSQPLNWDIEFYDQLQNQIGGGKPKMRWFHKFLSFILETLLLSIMLCLWLWLWLCFFFCWKFSGTLRNMVGLHQRYLKLLQLVMKNEPSWLTLFRFLCFS